ncbi:MAG TPA: hypothetical protein VK604_29055 [Bryobacteraceae bacterium]|nr:hypothetical protein [Bryobacteraceae bacterium]
MTALKLVPCALLLTACGAPPKPATPALTPETAAQLLHYNAKASVWLAHVKKQNPTCEYKLEIPNQMASPVEIDVPRIVWCGGQPAPRELNASVSFEYDKSTGRWTVARFAS